ncbi:MAG: TIR domain-containing protein, partial [Microthrixaceae bacterium]
MHHVFLSYSRHDSPAVDLLERELSTRGVPTWVDRTNLPFSVRWMDEISDAIMESALFAVIDSAHWQSSAPCSAELSAADSFQVPTVEIDAGWPVESQVDVILGALAATAASRRGATELSVRSRDWQRAGRPRNMLVSSRVRNRLTKAFAPEAAESQVARSFLRASRRRTVRRAAIGVFLAFVAIVAVAAVQVFRGLPSMVDEDNEQLFERLEEINVARRNPNDTVYDDLQQAADSGSTESAFVSDLIEPALRTPVPDQLIEFAGPTHAFLTDQIGHELAVELADGTRATAEVPPDAEDLADVVGPTGLDQITASFTDDEVVVMRDGALARRFTVPGIVRAVSVAPHTAEIAIAAGDRIFIGNIETGQVVVRLAGAPAELTDVAWSAGGRRVWA